MGVTPECEEGEGDCGWLDTPYIFAGCGQMLLVLLVLPTMAGTVVEAILHTLRPR